MRKGPLRSIPLKLKKSAALLSKLITEAHLKRGKSKMKLTSIEFLEFNSLGSLCMP
jgi:hypothetical protein